MGILKYIKAAFVDRWNLLCLFGGLGFATLSGSFDVVAPLLIAAEVGYLGFLGTHPKYQAYIEAQEAKASREKNGQNTGQTLRLIMQALPKPALARFENLRARCLELRQIATDLGTTSEANTGASFESLQLSSLDRLLWIFLRLLFTEFSLSRFLQRTDLDRIQDDIAQVQKKLNDLAKDESAHNEKIRRTLLDNLQTCQDRLSNFEKAKANHELVGLEIDRLENKIKSVAELAINRQEPDFISSQVDQVATSMVETEKTMNDLRFATGLGPIEEEVPELVRQPPVQFARH